MVFRWFKWTDKYRIWIRVYNLLFTFFTFSIYIRLIVEAYFMMLVSSFSEVYEHDLSSGSRTASFYINIAILISLLIVLGIWISQILKAHPTLNPQKQKYFVEFFNGIRNTTYSRINSVLFLIQRILGWSVVIFLVDSSLVIKLSIITVIQVLYLTYLLIVRPYKERKDLFLECINQSIVGLYSSALIKYSNREKWNSFINWMLIASIIVWASISTLTSLICLVISILKKARAFCSHRKRIENYRNNNYRSANVNQNVENIIQSRINIVELIEENKSWWDNVKVSYLA